MAKKSKKLKVAILYNIMVPYRFPLFQLLARNKNIDLTVLYMSGSAKNRRWKLDKKNLGFKYKILPKIEFNFQGKDLFTYILNYTFPIEFCRGKYDVLISGGWLDFACQAGFFLSKLVGKKYIIWSESTQNEPSWRRTVAYPLVRLIARGADACIAIGTRAREYLRFLGAKGEKIFISYSTVDVGAFFQRSRISGTEKESIKRKIGIKTDKVILYVGQFIERKGIIYLLKAFARLKKVENDVSLLLVGYGPLEGKYKNYINKKQIKDVFFHEHLGVEEIPKIYAISNVFVLPSLEETWGVVINEAMACGLPVVTTRKVGSSDDLVEHGRNGYVVKSGSYRQLEMALKKIISDSTLANRMSSASLAKIREITPREGAKAFIKAIGYVSAGLR